MILVKALTTVYMHLEVTAQLPNMKTKTAYIKKHSCGSYTVGRNFITINDNSDSSPIKLEITSMTKSYGEFHGQFKAATLFAEWQRFGWWRIK